MKFIYVFVIILSIYKSFDWINVFHAMVFKIVMNNKIQIIFKLIYIFKTKKKWLCTILEKL